MSKLKNIELGMSDGQRMKKGLSDVYLDVPMDEIQEKSDKADAKQAARVKARAKAGKQKAKKALNMSEVSDDRLDQILSATGEQQDRAARKAGKLY